MNAYPDTSFLYAIYRKQSVITSATTDLAGC
jgi:hypothetical protein